MDLELDPPNGITGYPLGAPADAVRATAARLGRVDVQDEGSAEQFHPMKVSVFHPQFEIVFTFRDGATLGSAEVWIPRPGPEDITVRFRGTDVFRTPARQLLTQLREQGHTVLDETHYAYVPHLCLGFTRVAGHDVPLDSDGEPLYFQAVLTAGKDYYNYKLNAS